MAKAKVRKLTSPRTLSKDPIYDMSAMIAKSFSRVVLTDTAGKEVAVVLDAKGKSSKISSTNQQFLAGLIIANASGNGNAPSGIAMWVDDNIKAMVHLNKYTLKAVATSRGSTLEAPVPVWIKVATAKAALIRPSIAKYPIPHRTRTREEVIKDEEVDIIL